MAQEAPASVLAKLIKGPTEFFGQVLVIMAPLVAVYAIVFGKKFLRSLRPTTTWAHFFDTIFLAIGVQVLVLVFAIGITSIKEEFKTVFRLACCAVGSDIFISTFESASSFSTSDSLSEISRSILVKSPAVRSSAFRSVIICTARRIRVRGLFNS